MLGQRVRLSLPDGLVGQSYNPSVAKLPVSVLRQFHCAECHVVTIRFDWANGCDSSKTLTEVYASTSRGRLGHRKGTLVMVVNSSQRYRWEPISWGWLKLGGTSSEPLVAQAHKIDTPEAMRGSASLVDVRLFLVAGELHAIGYDATRGWTGVIGHLHLHVNPAARRVPGRPAALNAWVTASSQRTLDLGDKECLGRSQAFFDVSKKPSRQPAQLAFLSWIAPSVVVCGIPNGAVERGRVRDADYSAVARVMHRTTGLAAAAAALRGCQPAASVDRAGRPKYQPGSRCRLSLNGVLLRLAESDTLLGVGHLHRGFRASLFDRALSQRLAWGAHHYTHFFFEIAAHPPHNLLAVGPEFCLVDHGESPESCEVVQYVTGVSRAEPSDELVLAYGVNDCEPRIAKLSMRSVRRDLVPV